MNEDCDSRSATHETDEQPEAEPDQRLTLDIVLDDGMTAVPAGLDAETFKVSAQTAAQAVAVRNDLLPEGSNGATIMLSCDAVVAELNGAYRGKHASTNVLSFPAPAGFPAGPDDEVTPLGDIVLAAETVAAEASDLGRTVDDHVRHLVVHGLLHLLGFDHENAGDAEKMEALEVEILKSIGVADPYAGTEPVA